MTGDPRCPHCGSVVMWHTLERRWACFDARCRHLNWRVSA